VGRTLDANRLLAGSACGKRHRGRPLNSVVRCHLEIAIFGAGVPWSKVVNSIGLVLDISGAILLFKFGLPEDVRREGQSYLLLESTDEDQIAKGKRYDRYGKLGVALLVSGFFFQFVSNFL